MKAEKASKSSTRQKCANPIILNWLREWQSEAQKNSNAADAVSQHPIQFKTIKETESLKGIGNAISTRLQKKLEQYIQENNGVSPLNTSEDNSTLSEPSVYESVHKDNNAAHVRNSRVKKSKPLIHQLKDHPISITSTVPNMNYRLSNIKLSSSPPSSQTDQKEIISLISDDEELSSQSNSIPSTFNSTNTIKESSFIKLENSQGNKKKPYIPQYRSGGYAMILVLYEAYKTNPSYSLSKQEIISKAIPLCEASFTLPGSSLGERDGSSKNIYYTAWSSMTTLIKKGLVEKKAFSPPRYTITTIGVDLAERMTRTQENMLVNPSQTQSSQSDMMNIATSTDQDIVNRSQPSCEIKFKHSQEPLHLAAGSFEVMLVIDIREVQRHKDTTVLLESFLSAEKIPFTYRSLPIGDFVWICKSKNNGNEQKLHEVTLDYIIERKREDDFISSILDGRFEEQKFRLGRSGFRNVIYLIEKYSGTAWTTHRAGTMIDHFGKGKFLSAVLHTQIINNCFIKQTEGFEDTLLYIKAMSLALSEKYTCRDIKMIPEAMMEKAFIYGIPAINEQQTHGIVNTTPSREQFKNRKQLKFISPIYHCTFEDFSRLHSKSSFLTQRDLYIKQLTCIRMMSPERALAISKIYPTMLHLITAYDNMPSEEDRKNMLKDIVYELPHKKIGNKLSERVYEIISCKDTIK